MCVKLPTELNTLDLAMARIQAAMAAQQRATVAIFTSSYAKFPDYDGFNAYRSMVGDIRVFGYPCKLNRAYPKREAARGVVERSFFLRGNASFMGNQNQAWEYCSKAYIVKDVLCYSLAPLYPAV